MYIYIYNLERQHLCYVKEYHYSNRHRNISTFLEGYHYMNNKSKLQWTTQPKSNEQSYILWRKNNT